MSTTVNTPTPEQPLRIINGRVIDPANSVDAVREVCVQDGRVVDALPADASPRIIDAKGQLVLPGGIDMHTHVASRGVAIAHEMDAQLAPAPTETAARYLRMGYTTVVDAAVPPEDADFAQRRLDAMAPLDGRFLLELGTHGELIDALATHSEAEAVRVIDELIERCGAFGIKLVNLRRSAGLNAPLNGTSITPRRLIRFAAEAAEHLPVVHPVHLHVPDLGAPDNVSNTLEALEALDGHRAHLAHAQFYAYRADAQGQVTSGAQTLIDYLDAHPNVTIDSGCVAFGPALMITRDHPLGEGLAKLTGAELTRCEEWSVMPMRYSEASAINAVQWAIGLELILRRADLSRVALSVDHPNGGPFDAMPALMELLANRAARQAVLEQVHDAARQRTGLGGIDRELTERELVVLTRTAPAAALGLRDRGHLGAGAVGDVVVSERVWARPRVVVKSGRVHGH